MEPDYTAAGCRASFDESCARLGLETLAGLRVHDPDDVEGGASSPALCLLRVVTQERV